MTAENMCQPIMIAGSHRNRADTAEAEDALRLENLSKSDCSVMSPSAEYRLESDWQGCHTGLRSKVTRRESLLLVLFKSLKLLAKYDGFYRGLGQQERARLRPNTPETCAVGDFLEILRFKIRKAFQTFE